MESVADPALSAAETRDLGRIAAMMIPADAARALPSAGEPGMIAELPRALGRDGAGVQRALAALAVSTGGAFADLAPARAEAVAAAFLGSDTPAVSVLGRVVLQCYYRDDRVLRALGLEPRPPFPMGHTLEPGTWSLLDAVRNRPKLWRDDRLAPRNQEPA